MSVMTQGLCAESLDAVQEPFPLPVLEISTDKSALEFAGQTLGCTNRSCPPSRSLANVSRRVLCDVEDRLQEADGDDNQWQALEGPYWKLFLVNEIRPTDSKQVGSNLTL